MAKGGQRYRKLEVFIEFLVFGIAIGVIEDLLVVKITTGEPITWHTFVVIVAIAIPFAFLGEVIVDRIDLADWLEKRSNRRKRQ